MKLSDDKALEYVKKFMSESSEFRRPYDDLWNKMLREYANGRSVKSNPLQRANLKLPYAFTIVETFVPQVVSTYLTEKPYLKIEGRRRATSMVGDAVSSFFTYQLERSKFPREFQAVAKSMSIFGTGLAKTNWTYKSKPITKTVTEKDLYGIPTTKKVPTEEVEYDGPAVSNISVFDFFPDPSCVTPGDIQGQIGCGHRVFRTFDQLKLMEKRGEVGIYKNLDKLKKNMGEHGYNAWTNLRIGSEGWNTGNSGRVSGNLGTGNKNFKGKLEIWEYWGKIPSMCIDGEDYENDNKEYVITVANGDTLIRFDENPYDYKFKPFLACPNYVVPNEFYGIGDIEIVLSLIKEGTSLRNARLDQANQAVNRMWIVDRNGGINLRNLYSRSGGIILTNDMNAIKELNPPEVPGSGYKETSQIDFDIQNATSLINPSQATSGLGRAFGQTSGGVDFLKSFTAGRMNLKVKNIDEWFMADLGKQLQYYNRQFTREKVWTYLFEEETNPYVEIEPSLFHLDFDFFVTGASQRLGKQQMQQEFTGAVVPFLDTVEKYQPNTVKMDGIVKRFFKMYDYRSIDDLVNTPEEREQLTAQQQAAQQQAQLQQIQLQQQMQQSMVNTEQQAKMERDMLNADNKKSNTLIKGMFEVAKAKIAEGGKVDGRELATGL